MSLRSPLCCSRAPLGAAPLKVNEPVWQLD